MNSKPASLYICYQSILEPLTQTQVIAYLEGLASTGYTLVLLTFEPRVLSRGETADWRIRMAQKGIAWHWLRYHKRPTVPATAWDVLSGIMSGWQLSRQHRLKLIHARAHVPGIMAMVLKWLTGAKFLFDIRGFMAEEYADAGIWSENGPLFRLTKRAERMLVRGADGIIVLTEKAKTLVQAWYPAEIYDKPIQVIPCCVDLREFSIVNSDRLQELPVPQHTTIVYTGKLGGWYPTREMVEFVAASAKIIPDLQWRVWTQSDSSALQQELAAQRVDRVTIGRVEPKELLSKLLQAHVGLSLYKRNLSAAGCSPTKIGEYLAAGLPVVSTAGIGDVDALLHNDGQGAVGVIVQDLTESSYSDAACKLKTLLEKPGIRERCRSVAERNLDLEHVGWPRYRIMYGDLLGK